MCRPRNGTLAAKPTTPQPPSSAAFMGLMGAAPCMERRREARMASVKRVSSSRLGRRP